MFTTRRIFLASLSAAGVSMIAWRHNIFAGNKRYPANPETKVRSPHLDLSSTVKPLTADHSIQKPAQFIAKLKSQGGVGKGEYSKPELLSSHPSDYLETVEHSVMQFVDFDAHVVDNLVDKSKPPKLKTPDLILNSHELTSLHVVVGRLRRLQSFVGYANFNVISWDQSLKYARNYPDIGAFEKSELDFIEQIFSSQADRMGFYGEKVITQISSVIHRNDIKKIPGTGHYLFKGDSIRTYEKIRGDIGRDVVLTSGIRGVVKQIYLFLKKTSEVAGNLSIASVSLAPPGHSFHAIGDFDVGKANFGKRNFTAAFASTDEFKKLSTLGYIDIRYPQNNPFGVRYEPWHIKVV